MEAVARLVAFCESGVDPEEAATWRAQVKPEVWAKLAAPPEDGSSEEEGSEE